MFLVPPLPVPLDPACPVSLELNESHMLKTRNLNTLPMLATLWLALTEQCLKGKPATAVSSSQKHCTHPDLPLVCRSTEILVLVTDLPSNLMDVPPPLPKTANCRILLKKKKIFPRLYREKRTHSLFMVWLTIST